MSSQNEITKNIHHRTLFKTELCPKGSAAFSFSIAILVLAFGSALFSYSFSKFSETSDCQVKTYLLAAMGVSIFQAVIGLCVAIFEWMEIRQQKLNLNVNPVRWIHLLSSSITLIAWIFIGVTIVKSHEIELEYLSIMVACNCILLCTSCLVPSYTVCLKTKECEESNEKIVIP